MNATEAPPADAPRSSKPNTRQRILDVALKHFARRGYVGATLDDIAREVGIRRPSLLHHFRDKNTLYLAVWNRAIADQDRHLEPYFNQPDTGTLELFHLAVDAWLDYAFNNPDFVYLTLFAAVCGRDPDFPRGASTATVQRWKALLDRGVAEGLFNQVPLVDCVSLLAGMTGFYLVTPSNNVPELMASYSGDRLLFGNRMKQMLTRLLVKGAG